MAKPNYQFEKRQRDLAKKKKQDEKRQRKLAGTTVPNTGSPDPAAEPPGAPGSDAVVPGEESEPKT